MIPSQPPKDPAAILDYGFTWRKWLQSGETISSAVWTVPTGITLVSQEESGIITKVWLSGGEAGVEYILTCHITASSGRADDRSFKILVKER